MCSLGKCIGMEINHKARTVVKKGDPSCAIRIECATYEQMKTYGRHFNDKNEMYSMVLCF